MRFSFASILLVAGVFVALVIPTVAQTPLPNFVQRSSRLPRRPRHLAVDRPISANHAPPVVRPFGAVVNYEMLAPADAVPPAIPASEADAAIKQLQKRLAEVEGQLKKRDDADKKAASASLVSLLCAPLGACTLMPQRLIRMPPTKLK